jgi:uncharacterized protein (TIGR00369 family)
MSGPDLEGLEDFASGHGFLSWLGLDVVEVEPGRAVLHIPAKQQLRNVGQMDPPPIHGGVISTLIDTTCSVALRTTFEDPAHTGLTTTNMDVSYLRPATGDLEAVAEVVRAGSSMGVVDATVTSEKPDGERVEVAVGKANFRIFRGGEE